MTTQRRYIVSKFGREVLTLIRQRLNSAPPETWLCDFLSSNLSLCICWAGHLRLYDDKIYCVLRRGSAQGA